ncbi:helix-turn-helix domain-containing protein [Mycoplana ramosa]|uniref:Multiprotein-bridging factor 1 family protein n=1 Tax=Mycoplana ramosa TaxID=40837 RepID=A0ABW3YTF8_MYCRA
MITPAQCRAGRALIDWTKDQLAEAASVSPRTISDFECGKKGASEASRRAIEAALFDGGVLLVGEDEAGVGVRLKFTRREVKAIDVLENEGGPTGEDDQLPL